MSDDARLLERIMKLLALAGGTNFAAEAASARRMAETLIAKHNVQLPSAKHRTAFDWVNYTPHFKGAQWEWMMADWAARACGCKAFFNTVGEPLSVFSLVGSVADVQACQYLLAILHEQRMRDWLRAKAAGTHDSFYSFCFSFARGLEANLRHSLHQDELKRTEQARLWWGTQVDIKNVDLGIRGKGRSEAGRNAGKDASLHRGNIPQNAPLKRIRDS